MRLLPLAAALAAVGVAGLALADVAAAPTSAGPGSPNVVEVVRYLTRGEYTVEERFWVDLNKAPDANAVADKAVGIVPGAATVAAQYKVGKHRWAAESLPIEVYYNPAGAGSNPSAAAAIEAGVSQWNGVTPATFSLAYAGTSTRGSGACADEIVADGFNTIRYSSALAFGVLGRTCTLFKSGPILEFDMELDAATSWSVAGSTARGSYDLGSTILHELGHAAGISHPCEQSAGCTAAERSSVMYPYLNDGDQRRTLTEDDRSALRAQYPGGPAPTPAPTAVAIPAYSREFSAVVVSLARD